MRFRNLFICTAVIITAIRLRQPELRRRPVETRLACGTTPPIRTTS